MRVLVCGGRDYRDDRFLRHKLDELHARYNFRLVIHGDAPGADFHALRWADDMEIEWWGFPAAWETFGKKAGHLRNKQMLDEGKPNLVVAFPGGHGTSDMVLQAKKASIVVIQTSRHNDLMKTRSEAKKEASTDDEKEEKIKEISEKLKDELAPPANPFNFPSVNKAKVAKLRPDLDQIVEVVFVNDMHETWKKLREGLAIGEKRSDHGTLQKALDYAEKRAHDAHRLYVTAKIERDRWERENEVIFGAMWSGANHDLQKEKNDGLRSKQITDADVKARIATLYPDEFQAQETRRAKIKATVESLEDLAEQWKSRCRTLQTMLGKLRS